eukprot:16335_2
MTDVDAVFTKPPGTPGAERIAIYSNSTTFEEGAKSTMGRGGMGSKIGAARKAAFAGANCIIANGIHIPNITKVFKGEDIGTLFLPSDPPSTTQNFWLSHMAMPSGKLKVKASTFEALKAKMMQVKKEKKDLGEFVLNVSDVVESEGDFSGKSVLSLVHADSLKTIGRAVTQQGSDEIQAILRMLSKGSKVTSQLIANGDDLTLDLDR